MKPDYFIYFDLEELVCKHVYDKYGDIAWSWFDPRLLETVHWIREKMNTPMFANDWKQGGSIVNGKRKIYSQRGLRCNQCQLVKKATKDDVIYMTSHARGQAGDFIFQGMLAEEVRQWIISKRLYLPHKIRLEDKVSWVHIDVCNLTNDRVYLFNS